MTSRTPRPMFGGWYSYREWADHGFIPREPRETSSRPESEEPPPDAPADLLLEGPVNASAREPAEGREAERIDRPRAELDEITQGREAATRLAASTPGWFLMYGPASRKIWAYPTSPRAPKGLVLAAQDPVRLYTLIQRAEQQFGFVRNADTERSAHPTPPAV